MSETERAYDLDTDSIKEELSKLTFEELQNLKERIGTKIYNEALFGKRKTLKSSSEHNIFKRENKNRPREMTSKKPVTMVREIKSVKKQNLQRDPRFDPLCGEFDKKSFKEDYKFLKDVRSKDLLRLKKKLKQSTDETEIANIKYLIQRMNNQDREEVRLKRKQEKEHIVRENQVEQMKLGNKPVFIKKSEKKVLDLVDQYEELKKSGMLNKHIERKRKKNTQNSRMRNKDLV